MEWTGADGGFVRQDLRLWPYRIRTGEFLREDAWHREMAKIVADYCADAYHVNAHGVQSRKKNIDQKNLLMQEAACLTPFWEWLKTEFWSYLKEAWNLEPNDVTELTFRSSASRTTIGDWSPPHTDGGQLSILYCVDEHTSPNEPNKMSGRLNLVPPYSMPVGHMARRETGFYSFPFSRGHFLIMPSTVQHQLIPFTQKESFTALVSTFINFTATDYPTASGGAKSLEEINTVRRQRATIS